MSKGFIIANLIAPIVIILISLFVELFIFRKRNKK